MDFWNPTSIDPIDIAMRHAAQVSTKSNSQIADWEKGDWKIVAGVVAAILIPAIALCVFISTL